MILNRSPVNLVNLINLPAPRWHGILANTTMSLTKYKEKRSFSKTPEPKGKTKKTKGKQLSFVVQKHDATRLHYDFRLEIKGVLKSWAVPKGPSMNPDDKRLAVLVEDHPFDYKDFEGIIPPGNYGAGTVIIWDEGTYESADSNGSIEEEEKKLLKDFNNGKLSIVLKGKKLKGEFALVEAKGRDDNSWLLIKKKDQYASKEDITKKDKSVVSKKTIAQMEKNKKAPEWISNKKSTVSKKRETTTKRRKAELGSRPKSAPGFDIDSIVKEKGLKKAPIPKNIKPMLATLVDKPPEASGDNKDWVYEVKWDGYRTLAYIDKGKVDLRSRNNKSFNEKFYPIYNAMQEWKINAVVDGEIVVIDENGISHFGDLQNWRSEADGELFCYLFDVLWLDGYNLMDLPLVERREILKQIVPEEGNIRLSENFNVSGKEFFQVADKLGLEGIIAKEAESNYTPDIRTKSWLKIKTSERHEAIICGYTLNEGSAKQFSALILGVYEGDELKFIGQVGTGFADKLQKEIKKKLKPLVTKKCPFNVVPEINKPSRFRPKPPKAEVNWVRPELVCEVSYTELTADGIMRHPSFEGLRIDKDPEEVKQSESPKVRKSESQKVNKTKKLENSSGLTDLRTSGLLKGPKGKERKTLLNPNEETQTKTINGRDLKFTNLSKIYWPKEMISKRDMINYYYQMAPYIIPYMKDRPQSLNRYPNGVNGPSFYQKNVAGKVEKWITTHDYENTTQEGEKTFLVCTDEATLLYMANLGCIEMNPWHSRIQSADSPDWCVVDLDPDTNTFEQVIEAGNVVRQILDSIDVPSYVKTSGSTGLHIYIPLGAKYDYEQSKQLAELIVTLAHREISDFTSLERSPKKRKGKIYLDYLQNRSIQTIAAPYSLRPKPGATASAPLHWEEVKKGLNMKDFTIYNMLDRVKSEGDLFKGVLGKGIDLEKVLKRTATVHG